MDTGVAPRAKARAARVAGAVDAEGSAAPEKYFGLRQPLGTTERPARRGASGGLEDARCGSKTNR